MIRRTKTTTEISVIYEFGEGVKAAAEANVLKKLHGFTCIFFEKATKETKGSYIMRHIEEDIQEPEPEKKPMYIHTKRGVQTNQR